MRRCAVMIVVAFWALAFLWVTPDARSAKPEIPYPEIPRISLNDAKDMLGKPGVTLLDCRLEEQWNASENKLPGAMHENPADVKSWAERYPREVTTVIY